MPWISLISFGHIEVDFVVGEWISWISLYYCCADCRDVQWDADVFCVYFLQAGQVVWFRYFKSKYFVNPETFRMFSVDACCATSQSIPVSNIVLVGLRRTAYNATGIRTSKMIHYRSFTHYIRKIYYQSGPDWNRILLSVRPTSRCDCWLRLRGRLRQ